jgi:hypothetical protein
MECKAPSTGLLISFKQPWLHRRRRHHVAPHVIMSPPVAPPAESTMDLVTRAVHLLESDDSDIIPEQQGALINVLGAQGNEHFLKFYVTMKDKSGRRAFIERMIGELLVQQPDRLVQDTDFEMLALD